MEGPLSLKRKNMPLWKKVHCALPMNSVLLTVAPKEGQPAEVSHAEPPTRSTRLTALLQTTISLTGATLTLSGKAKDARYFEVTPTVGGSRTYYFYHGIAHPSHCVPPDESTVVRPAESCLARRGRRDRCRVVQRDRKHHRPGAPVSPPQRVTWWCSLWSQTRVCCSS